jgi:hypothetical protein
VGKVLGDADGIGVRWILGSIEPVSVGGREIEGFKVGMLVGTVECWIVGGAVGEILGETEVFAVGVLVGTVECSMVGEDVGEILGADEGFTVGVLVGTVEC